LAIFDVHSLLKRKEKNCFERERERERTKEKVRRKSIIALSSKSNVEKSR